MPSQTCINACTRSSQHFQTADSLAIIPPAVPSDGAAADSRFGRASGAKKEKAPLELLVGDCRSLKVVRFKQWAVEDQLKDHIPRLKVDGRLKILHKRARVTLAWHVEVGQCIACYRDGQGMKAETVHAQTNCAIHALTNLGALCHPRWDK
eukprot:1118201-Pelagomonas_calceolata.AAC.3